MLIYTLYDCYDRKHLGYYTSYDLAIQYFNRLDPTIREDVVVETIRVEDK